MEIKMTSSRPYLLRAFYDWIVDNHLTPYILVDAIRRGVQVPFEYVRDGKIVLNISPQACQGLHIQNDRILFTARFGNDAVQVSLPPGAVLAIYARENGRGMVFSETEEDATTITDHMDDGSSSSSPGKAGSGKPHLTIIK